MTINLSEMKYTFSLENRKMTCVLVITTVDIISTAASPFPLTNTIITSYCSNNRKDRIYQELTNGVDIFLHKHSIQSRNF